MVLRVPATHDGRFKGRAVYCEPEWGLEQVPIDAVEKGAEGAWPSAVRKRPPVVRFRYRPSSKPFERQSSHPARVVAGAGTRWRTSAHKRSPLFHRRAPVPSTVDPTGLLATRAAEQATRRPVERTEIQAMRGATRSVDEEERSSRPAGTRATRDGTSGRRKDAQGAHREGGRQSAPWYWRLARKVVLGINGPEKICGACAWCVRTPPTQAAVFLCRPDIGCTTRTRRPCRCGGAWTSHTAGNWASGRL